MALPPQGRRSSGPREAHGLVGFHGRTAEIMNPADGIVGSSGDAYKISYYTFYIYYV